MSAILSIMDKFWGVTEMMDQRRLATLKEPDAVTRITDIPYLDDGDPMHQLDVYYPDGTTDPLPVIIDVHGGGWMYGDKELNRLYCLTLASRGYTVFNMSYRLVPTVTVNEQIRDVMCALQWIEAHLCDYPCQPDRILLTGDSAGGMLAGFAAALLSSRALRSVFDTVDCSLKLSMLALTSPVAYMDEKGVMGVYTRKMWGDDYRRKPTAPYMNISALLRAGKLPPTFLVTSSGDFMALQQTRKLAHELKGKGVPVDFMEFPTFEGQDLPHVFSVVHPESKAAKLVFDRMLDMFEQVCQ